MFSKKKIVFSIIILLIIASLITVLITILSQKPPTEKIEAGRKAIAEAIKEEADIYSLPELTAAQNNWIQQWQNGS